MKITWYGHACFCIESNGYRVVMDPYTGVPGHPDLHIKAQMARKSHEHGDHSYLEAVEIINGDAENPFQIREIDCWHDDAQGTLRGSNKITIFEAEGLKVAHFGDLGEELSAEQLEQLKGLDAAMVPVGGFFTIDGKQAAELMCAVDPSVTIPMHYRWGEHGYDVISEVDAFTNEVTDRPVIVSEDTSIEIGNDAGEKRVVLLKCEGPEV